MGVSQNDGKMEGWLYIIRSNRFGLKFLRKRYFILRENYLKCFKTRPISQEEKPLRSANIDFYIRITDNGRESINRKVFFIFTLYNTLKDNDQLKLGASSSEDAGKWIRSLQTAVVKECPNPEKEFMSFSKKNWPPSRFGSSKRADSKRSAGYYHFLQNEAVTSDVIAPSTWKIFGCQNGKAHIRNLTFCYCIYALKLVANSGLRLFKEAKDWNSRGRKPFSVLLCPLVPRDQSKIAGMFPLIFLKAELEAYFVTIFMGSVVEHLDGHTNIIHKKLYSNWLPWGMRRRDLLLRRYWRREEDGTYGGGYVITPVNQGRESLVKHMLAIDWKFWKVYLRPPSARSITICMLERIAALRGLFRAKAGNYSSDFSSSDSSVKTMLPQAEMEAIESENKSQHKFEKNADLKGNEAEKINSGRRSLMSLNDASDEFFDFPDFNEDIDFDLSDNGWFPEKSQEQPASHICQHRLSSAAVFVKKLHDLAVQKKGYMNFQELPREENVAKPYGKTLQKDSACSLPCSWATGEPSTFLIRGENYLKDNQKIRAEGSLMQMVGADWLRSDHREDDLGSRPESIIQKYAAQGRPEFFFVINMQIPGATQYTLALYYMLKTPLEETPLLHSFVHGDDAFRNSRFKLIPYISKGSWIVKQSVGKKACLVGQALEMQCFRGKNYLELDIDVGSSTVARGVASLALGYLNNLVIEMAFVIQGNDELELPEILVGTCRLSNLDVSKAVLV
ncbi:ENHANCED DISEASE RESISTANCE-RELATED [Salix viminalis]|uniref:ENHANCED DISEASE RESISTANCE-RELATED n=1 Tax=Salix viminalis TaxID=40686 RepID=A0A9Q0TYQ3_SALVM|nr:ENHANCED DISEASE RESISTANCE-RELATED [Salix viminalis]